MTPRIQYISVDINGNRSINNLRIKQYDKDIRYIYATITENGVPLDLTEYTGIVSVHKPDNTAVLNNVTEITGSVVKIQLTEQMGAADGVALFEIQLRTLDGGVITTVTFNVKVDKAVNSSDTITSSYEFNALNEALIEVQESIEYIDDLKTLGILTADMKGEPDGVASLDVDAKIPIDQIPDEAKLWETLPSGHITNTDNTTVDIDGGAIIYGKPTQLPTGIGDYTLIRNNTISAHDGAAYKDLNIGSVYNTDKTPLTMKADGSTIINTPSTKTTPIDADNLYVSDSADSSKLKKTTLANFKATLKSYFDTLYTAFIPIAQKGTANGVAATDASNKITGDVLTNIINDLTSSTTRTYSSNKINALISSIVGLELLVVAVLPTTNINTHAIYLVPQASPTTGDGYDEYVYINSAWEHIGSTTVDLSNYLKKTDNYAGSSSSAGAANSAVRLETGRAIDGILFSGTSNVSHYGVSSTTASTVAKEVTINNFSLVTGARVSIKFTNGNSVNNPTLNVSTTGAKFIYVGTVQAIASDIVAGSIYDMIYDGTNFQLATPPSESIILTQAQYDSLSVGEQNNGKTYYISDAPQGDVDANLVYYDNSGSGLSATNIQEAVDELAKPTKILDVNGNEVLKFVATPNAVNEVTIYNNTSNQSPGIFTSGDAANIGLSLATKGNGAITSFIGNSIGLLVKAVANTLNAVNYLVIASNVTNQPVIIGTAGTDANIDLVIEAKGTGGVVLNRVNFTEATTLANIVSGESNTTLWGKVKKMFSFIGTTTLTTTAQTISTAINELNTNLSRNFLNNSKNFKQVKMEYGQPLKTFTNGVATITLSQSYTDGVAVVNILGADLASSSVEGDVLTIVAARDGVPYNGTTSIRYQIMGY